MSSLTLQSRAWSCDSLEVGQKHLMGVKLDGVCRQKEMQRELEARQFEFPNRCPLLPIHVYTLWSLSLNHHHWMPQAALCQELEKQLAILESCGQPDRKDWDQIFTTQSHSPMAPHWCQEDSMPPPPVPTPSKDSGHHGKSLELCIFAGSMEYQQSPKKRNILYTIIVWDSFTHNISIREHVNPF